MTDTTVFEEEKTPIGRLFKRLAGTYGAAWQRSLGVVPIMDVKTAWAHELSWFLSSRETMECIAWALENLPERPPNVIEFRNLCRSMPAPVVPHIARPRADPARVADELEKLAPLRRVVAANHGASKDWARRIMDRHEAGDKTVNRYALWSARIALRLDTKNSEVAA